MLRTTTFSVIAVFVGFGVAWGLTHAAIFTVKESRNVTLGPAHIELASVADAMAASSSIAKAESKDNSDTLTILMAGDVMLDRNIRQQAQSSPRGYDGFFASTTSFFKSADIAVANLEGPITENASKTYLADGTYSSQLTFTFDPATVEALIHAGLSVVSLANNHTDNFGMKGFRETERWLDAGSLRHFGSYWNATGTEAVFDMKGMRIAFVGYHAFYPGFDHVLADVKRLTAEGDFVIVMPHWGVEYQPHPTADQKEKARQLVAAGAKAVIGAHPHVIEDHEWIGQVPVFYSLGNFLFDQYFSAETMKGQVVELNLKKTDHGPELDSVDIYEASTMSHKPVSIEKAP